MRHHCVFISCVFALLALAAAQPSWAANWYLTDLGLPAGDSICVATGINANGQIVGYAGQGGPSAPYELQEQVEACGGGTAFTWGAGTMTTLPTTMNVGGTQVPLNCAIGLGINSAGVVAGTVGYNDPVSGAITGAAAVYSGGQWNSLGANTGQANWISNNGQTIAGGLGQGYSAFVVTGGVGGTLSQINGSQAIGYAGNSSGMIVGGLNYGLPTDSGGTLPWYYTGAGGAHTVDPGATGEFSPSAGGGFLAVNSSGTMVGDVSDNVWGQVSATYSLAGGWTDISYNINYASGHGIPEQRGSSAYGCELGAFGIDDAGDIVGADGFKNDNYSDGVAIPKGQHAYLAAAGGSFPIPADLNLYIPSTAGWVLEGANAIATVNVPGHVGEDWIVGYGLLGGATQAFLLTPTPLDHPGDANGDGRVDVNDLAIVLTNFGSTTDVSWATGDFNDDGKVDVNDLTIVLANFGYSTSASGAGPAAVPEPGALAMFGACLTGLLAWAWRKRG